MTHKPAFFELAPDTLARYVKSIRACSSPLWFFQHIPKTAGSSLSAELEDNLGPYLNVLPDYDDERKPFNERLDEAVSIALDDLAAMKFRSASGHVRPRHVSAILAASESARVFTYLRNPLKRCISEYAYNCSTAHPPHEAFKAQFPTFERFALDPAEANKMSRFLLPRWDMQLGDALSFLNEHYVMIGLQERYPVCFLLLSSMAWQPSLPRRRVRVGNVPEFASSLSDTFEREFMEANRLDYGLYQAVENVYNRLAPAVWSELSPQTA